ncbi:MAG TPA: heat-shock protein [Planctomycetaceae bacterium]|mgnify:FL=1|uniref:Hsp20/alpha crystallin family protein n=1 Tax=Gimesia sp. TaxID=2024833 RepID=UPI000C4D58DE|nr:Hsp20/alpha crystallin family protein [Gimesia sp.]MAX37374.1 heat-shock protein [Gimesia sp.]HAH44340.1 heat-shock protein [Planctomycetaceae bacterium]|tara:strand:+ start:13495 stop:13878 length:384 start_codon:yes stop_codon:yes gene_type:complete
MSRPHSEDEPREFLTPEQFVFTPPIDIYETDEGLVLYADLPGVSVGSLELQVQDNKLTLLGKVEPQIPEGALPLHKEYEVGNFLRSFILSGEIVHSEIEAKLANGVLRIFLPKAPKAEPRRIQVNTG